VNRFPPAEVAAKLATSLGIGLLVGIEREWSNKDLGARTFALTALIGTMAALFSPAIAVTSIVGVFLIVIFANARSLLVDRSLEATTSPALLLIYVLGALVGGGHLFTPVAAAILMTMLLAWKVELHRFAGGLQPEEIRSAVLLREGNRHRGNRIRELCSAQDLWGARIIRQRVSGRVREQQRGSDGTDEIGQRRGDPLRRGNRRAATDARCHVCAKSDHSGPVFSGGGVECDWSGAGDDSYRAHFRATGENGDRRDNERDSSGVAGVAKARFELRGIILVDSGCVDAGRALFGKTGISRNRRIGRTSEQREYLSSGSQHGGSWAQRNSRERPPTFISNGWRTLFLANAVNHGSRMRNCMKARKPRDNAAFAHHCGSFRPRLFRETHT
jgi:MgtC family